MVEKLEEMSVIEAVGNILCSVGQDPQLLRVLLLVHFILCLFLRNCFVVIFLQENIRSRVLASKLMQH